LKVRENILNTFFLASLTLIMLVAMMPVTFAQQAPKGSWVDEIVISVEQDEAKVVDMLLKNEIQAYFRDITDPELFSRIKASPDLWYATSYGLYFDRSLIRFLWLPFNPFIHGYS